MSGTSLADKYGELDAKKSLADKYAEQEAAAQPPPRALLPPPQHAADMAAFDAAMESGEPLRTRGRGVDAQLGPTKGDAALRGLGVGASLEHGDEAGGFGAWLASHLPGGAIAGMEGVNVGDVGAPEGDIPRAAGRNARAPLSSVTDYEAERNADRAEDALAREHHPYVFGATEAIGSAAPAAVLHAAAAPALGGMAPVARAAAEGGALGGVTGEGASTADTALGVAADAAIGLGAGAGTAALLTAGAPIIARGTRNGVQAAGDAIWRAPSAAQAAAESAVDSASEGAARREIELGGPEIARKAELLADPNSPQGKVARARATAGASDATVEGHASALGSRIDELLGHGEVVKWNEDIASKGRAIKSMIGRDVPPSDGLNRADAVYDQVRGEWDNLVSDVGEGEGAATVRRLQREAFGAYEDRLKKAADKFDPSEPSGYVAERFMALDDLKRHLQKEIARARVPFDDLLRDRMEAPLRTALEDESIWGAGPAAIQKVRNAGWTRRLRASGSPEQSFLASSYFGEAGPDPYRVAAKHDPSKVLGIVRNAGKYGEQGAGTLRDWADREAGLLEALTSHEGADPALAQRAQRARSLSNEINGLLATRTDEASAASDMAAINGPRQMPPTAFHRVATRIPVVKNAVEALRPQPVGERAAFVAMLEDALSKNPSNAEALSRLRMLGADVQEPAIANETAAAVTAPIASESAPGVGSALARAGAQGAGTALAARATSAIDRATTDSVYGPMLAAHPPGEARDVIYSTLLMQDSSFRERERHRAEQQTEEKKD